MKNEFIIRTVILLAFLLGMALIPLRAQDCKMCGDWIGTYTISIPDPDPDGGMIDENVKMYVRIKRYGDDMSVRVKTHPVKDPNNLRYFDCSITNTTNNSISFTAFVGDDYDWDNTDKKNGRIIYKASYYWVCLITYYSGKMVLSRHFRADYYDKYNSWIDAHDAGYETITLYQEDDDW